MLLAYNLNIDVLIVILMQSSGRKRVSDPEIDGIRSLLQSYASPWYIFLNVREDGSILITKIIVLYYSVNIEISRDGEDGRVCAYRISVTSFLPLNSCRATKSTNSSKCCCSSQGFTNNNSPSLCLVGASAFLLLSALLFFQREATYPFGVIATLTLCPLNNSFRVSTFHALVACQWAAPPRITKGRFRATYRINSRAEGSSRSSSAADELSSL